MLEKNWKVALTHAFYVFGLTFFSTLSSEFYKLGGKITLDQFCFCFMSAFIAFGLSFFISLQVQSKSNSYMEVSPLLSTKKKKRLKVTKTNKSIKGSFWGVLLKIIHAPQYIEVY